MVQSVGRTLSLALSKNFERILRASSGGRDSLNCKQTNPATVAQECERRDSREALQGARASRHFQRAETSNWDRGRDAEVLLNPVRVRSRSEEVDSSALAVASPFRGES